MQKRSFGLGAALGAAVVASIAVVLRGDSRDPTPAGGAVGPAAPTDRAGRAPDLAQELEQELAMLRAENSRLREAAARRQIETGPQVATTSAVAAASPAPTGDEFLLHDFEDMVRSGDLAERFRADPEALRLFLLETWLGLDRPERALAILRNRPTDPMSASFARQIADRLWAKGQTGLAEDASRIALLDAPEDLFLIAEFAQRSPTAALAVLAEMEGSGRLPDSRAQRAVALLSAGRREEALALFDALAAEDQVPPMAWEQLLMTDPAAASERLRNRLASGDADPDTRLQLARALRAMGDDDAARTEALAILESNPEHGGVLQVLEELDPAAALTWIEGRMARGQGDGLWGAYARSLESQQRTDDALAAYWRAWEEDPSWEWSSRLLALDSVGAAARLTATAEQQSDDELFGDVADALWVAGRRAEAERLWRRALQLDPSDGEWIGKIQAIEAGRSPLN